MSGPFGLTQGMALGDIDSEASRIGPFRFTTQKVPKPHSLFETYVLQVTPAHGLSWIRAIGLPIQTNPHGIELRIAFDALEKRLGAIYGAANKTDFIDPDSTWSEPRDWMQSVLSGDRYLGAAWTSADGAKLKDSLISVHLCLIVSDTYTGLLAVEYEFENNAAATTEIVQIEDEAL